jgi:hypothetical protein
MIHNTQKEIAKILGEIEIIRVIYNLHILCLTIVSLLVKKKTKTIVSLLKNAQISFFVVVNWSYNPIMNK